LERFFRLGLDNIIVQRIVQNHEEQFEVVSTGFILRLTSLLILIPFGGLIIYFLRAENGVHVIAYIMLSSLIFRSFDVIDFWFLAYVKSKYVVYSKLISFSAYAILRFLVVFLGFGLVQLVIAFLLEGVIRTVLLVYVCLRNTEAISLPEFKLDRFNKVTT
jgi:hypothetical protein